MPSLQESCPPASKSVALGSNGKGKQITRTSAENRRDSPQAGQHTCGRNRCDCYSFTHAYSPDWEEGAAAKGSHRPDQRSGPQSWEGISAANSRTSTEPMVRSANTSGHHHQDEYRDREIAASPAPSSELSQRGRIKSPDLVHSVPSKKSI